MLQTFLVTLSTMLVMFLCMIIGFVLNKKKLIPENSDGVMSKLENYIFVPALVFSSFMDNCTVESLSKYYNIVLYSIVAIIFALIITFSISRFFVKENNYQRKIYNYALTFGNFAFMGNAIVPAILGSVDSSILFKYLLFTIPLNVAVYSWGVSSLVPEGEEKSSPLKNLLNPIFISLIVGAVFGLANISWYIPDFIIKTVDYCKACMAPVSMILTGFVIAKYPFKELISDGKIYIATALRLFVIPVVILQGLKLLGASQLILTLALFAYATPLGLNTVVFPAAYGGDSKIGASMAMISHTLSVISIPVMYAIFTMVM